MVFSVICGEFVRLFRCLNIHSKKTQSCIAKKWLIKNNNNPQCLHNRKNIRIFALRKVRNDINVIAMTWTKSREE